MGLLLGEALGCLDGIEKLAKAARECFSAFEMMNELFDETRKAFREFDIYTLEEQSDC